MTKFVRAFKDFSGGLSEVANDNIPNNRLMTAKNVIPGDGYGVARAFGTTQALPRIAAEGVTVGPVKMLTELEITDNGASTTHAIACTEQGGYWYMWDMELPEGWNWPSVMPDEAPVWTRVEYAASGREDGYTLLPMLDWFVYANKLFWLDGSDYMCYDGETIAPVPNTNGQTSGFWAKIQTAIAVEQRSTRWFFATKEDEVIPSEPGYYDKFTETTVINLNPGVTDEITCLHQFNDGLLVFLKRSVFYLTGWDFAGGSDVKLTKLNVESGTRWPKSVKTISNAVLYLGDNGLCRLSVPYYSSQIASSNLSDKQATKRLTDPAATDVYADLFNGVYYISLVLPTGIYEYRLYLNSGGWWGEYTQQPHCYAPKLAGADYMVLGCDNGFVLKYDEGSFHYVSTATGGASAIPVEVRTKGYDVVGGTVIDAKVKRVFLVLRQYDEEKSGLTVQVKTDYKEGAWAAQVDGMEEVLTAVLRDVEGDESLVWSEGNWGEAFWGWIDTVTKMFQINRKCKRVQFIFRDDNSDEPLLIYGIALQYKKKKAKGSRTGVTERTVIYDH